MSEPPASLEEARAFVGGVLGALATADHELDPIHAQTLQAIATVVLKQDVDVATTPPLDPPAVAAVITRPELRQLFVQVLVIVELMDEDVAASVGAAVAECARVLAVDEPMVHAAREFAEHHMKLMYADIQRHSWYNEETARRLRHGRLVELARTELATFGGPADDEVAARWRSLEDCAPGTWGRAVFEFYGANGFVLPGQRHSIREVGAEHDWVHVLADYPTTPEGEIDVFTFIAGSMHTEQGFAMMAATLGIYQNGTIRHLAGRFIPTATTGTVHDAASVQRFVEAFHRGRLTSEDVLDLDHFAWKDTGLEEARTRLGVTARSA